VAGRAQAAMARREVQGETGDHTGGTLEDHRGGKETRAEGALPVVLAPGRKPGRHCESKGALMRIPSLEEYEQKAA
jgi:hypothetical protein